MKKAKWLVNGSVVGGKYLGEVEAATEDEALALAHELSTVSVDLCHRCAGECENAEIEEITVERVDEGKKARRKR